MKKLFKVRFDEPLETRLFRNTLLVCIVASLFLLTHDVFLDFSVIDVSMELLGILFSILSFYMIKHVKNVNFLIIPFLTFVHLALDLAWFGNKGLGVSLSLDFLVVMIISIILLETRFKLVYLTLFLINMCSIFYTELFFEEFKAVNLYSRDAALESKIIFILITYSISAWLVIFLKNLYTSAISFISDQNELLEDQNEEIQAQSKTIKETNENLEVIVTERTNHIEAQKAKLLQFAFFNSHKLRAPLSNIQGLIKLLEDSNQSEEERNQILELLSKESNRMDAEIRYVQEIIHENPDDKTYNELLYQSYKKAT